LIDLTDAHAGKAADGGIVSPAPEAARVLAALMAGRLVPRPVLRGMHSYAFWSGPYQTPCGVAVYGHGGSGNAFKAEVLANEDGSRVAALLLNGRADPAMAARTEGGAAALLRRATVRAPGEIRTNPQFWSVVARMSFESDSARVRPSAHSMGKEREMRVRDVMTTDVATVAPGTELRDVATLLVQRRISGVPVVEAGRVLGVVSERDILFKERPADGLHRGVLGWLMDEGDLMLKVDARTAETAMTSPAVTIGPGRGVAQAAALMLDEGVSRLPVVDRGVLVGIVTRHDLVRAFARSDEEIWQEIEADSVIRSYWRNPGSWDVSVRGGEVTLTGKVGGKEQARRIEAFVDRVPGVVAVTSRLHWENSR
jgi:CBS domain-containing protein